MNIYFGTIDMNCIKTQTFNGICFIQIKEQNYSINYDHRIYDLIKITCNMIQLMGRRIKLLCRHSKYCVLSNKKDRHSLFRVYSCHLTKVCVL